VPSNVGEGAAAGRSTASGRILAKVNLMHYLLLIVISDLADHHSMPTMNQNQIINAIVRAAA
jgi:hypothetical protein